MSKLDLVLGFTLDCDRMIKMIEVLLDHQLGYCCCTGVTQVRFMYTSFQARENRSQRHGFYGRNFCSLCGFEGHPLNLDRGPSGTNNGHPLNSDRNSGNSWADCGHID